MVHQYKCNQKCENEYCQKDITYHDKNREAGVGVKQRHVQEIICSAPLSHYSVSGLGLGFDMFKNTFIHLFLHDVNIR
jgi:hypothetical protein